MFEEVSQRENKTRSIDTQVRKVPMLRVRNGAGKTRWRREGKNKQKKPKGEQLAPEGDFGFLAMDF